MFAGARKGSVGIISTCWKKTQSQRMKCHWFYFIAKPWGQILTRSGFILDLATKIGAGKPEGMSGHEKTDRRNFWVFKVKGDIKEKSLPPSPIQGPAPAHLLFLRRGGLSWHESSPLQNSRHFCSAKGQDDIKCEEEIFSSQVPRTAVVTRLTPRYHV